ncbi:MAG: hypothetical protein KAY37_08455 [Phycisphaerae bacterium]|nr:hypothetical protein [Phycisphaerae bacterium]
MNASTSKQCRWLIGAATVLALAAWGAERSAAEVSGAPGTPPTATTTPATTSPSAASPGDIDYQACAFRLTEAAHRTEMAQRPEWWPELGWSTLAWFAVVVILTLTLRPKRLLSLRNLDGLVLAGMCVLLALREETGARSEELHTSQWWAYLWLTVAAGYWLARGIGLVLSKKAIQPEGAVSHGTLVVLLAVGLVIGILQIAAGPISVGSHDGIVGGLYTASSGKLPYGDAEWVARRSPLLYLLHAGAVQVAGPKMPPSSESAAEPTASLDQEDLLVPMIWENRADWLEEPWCESIELAAARLVNAVLFLLMLAGLYVLGRQLHSAASGLTMIAIFCVFPGTVECLTRPEVMLPAVLLTWAVVFALLRGVGGLLGMLFLMLAGVAWPWAWLALPVLLAHFWRRGWQQVPGSLVGLLSGAALIVLGLLQFVQPTLPRTSAALAMAGLQPTYDASLAEDGTLNLTSRNVDEDIESQACSVWLWHLLVTAESTTADGAEAAAIVPPNGVSRAELLYRRIEPTPAALPVLQTAYRAAVAELPATTRLLVAARTVLEETWCPTHPAEPPTQSAWALWEGPDAEEGGLTTARRIVKLVVALLMVWATLAVFFGRRVRPRHLVGALLAVVSGMLIAGASGAVTNLVWLLPFVLALWAVHEEPEPEPEAEEESVPEAIPALASSPPSTLPTVPFDEGPEPRISVENQKSDDSTEQRPADS